MASDGRMVIRWTRGVNQVSRVLESGWPLPLPALICGPDGAKTPRKGSKRRFFRSLPRGSYRRNSCISIQLNLELLQRESREE